MPEKHHPTPEEHDERDGNEDDSPFEDVVAALLQVDPTGIAGKHRKDQPTGNADDG